MKVEITNLQKKTKINNSLIRKAILHTLKSERCPKDTHVSVAIAADSKIKQLNKTYRGKCSITDILAFPMQEKEFPQICKGILGEIVISAESAEVQAKNMNIPFDEEMIRLSIHGTLHLLSYTDTSIRNAKKMTTRQEQLVRELI
ncbi:MAG: rRNA maturation RNase YbeY [bacterium]|nr:rRNA maturation RNase YbeY [bacterium]